MSLSGLRGDPYKKYNKKISGYAEQGFDMDEIEILDDVIFLVWHVVMLIGWFVAVLIFLEIIQNS